MEDAPTRAVEAVERRGVEVAAVELIRGALHAGSGDWRRSVGRTGFKAGRFMVPAESVPIALA
jgi:hypothetical protein